MKKLSIEEEVINTTIKALNLRPTFNLLPIELMCMAYIKYNKSGIFINCEEKILDFSPNGYARLLDALGTFIDEGKIKK